MVMSGLNPNAPMFVPSAYRLVEDFSDQWWELVQSSPSFRDYWLQECFSDPEMYLPFSDIFTGLTFPDDTHGDVNDVNGSDAKGVEKEGSLDLVSLGWMKWRRPRGVATMPRYCGKAPKIVNMRVSPRPIQQPR